MIPDVVFTDKHYPFQKVTKERLQQAMDDLLELKFEVTVADDADKDGKARWRVGALLLGYEDRTSDEFYLHPFHMDAHELTEFEPMDSFEYLKTDDSLVTQIRKIASDEA